MTIRTSRRTFFAVAGLSLAAGCSAAGPPSSAPTSHAPTPGTASAASAATGSAGGPATAANVFTPVVAGPLDPVAPPVAATDGLSHVQFELQIVNGKAAPATLQRIDVLDPGGAVLRSYNQAQILPSLRTVFPAPAVDTVLAPGETRFLYVELEFSADIPDSVTHQFWLLAAANPGATEASPMSYPVAAVSLVAPALPVLAPPLRGDGWVDINGAFNPAIAHRGSIQTINGRFHLAQRYAIDWMRLNSAGRFIDGDPTDVRNNTAYGAEVLAVAGATVVSVLDELPDQPPGQLPDPASLTMDTVDGNHIVLDLGAGRYGFYAHLQRGSVLVRTGDRVTTGQAMARLGNSGNTSDPHLHFHVMDGPSVLGSSGLPYLIDSFAVAGELNRERYEATTGFEGDWGDGRAAPVQQTDRFPMDRQIVNFR